MHGHISTSAGLIGSVITCMIGVFNSHGTYVPLPKSPAIAIQPTFDCGYALVSHSAREVVYSGPDWGVQIQCELRNLKGRNEAILRCSMPFAGAVYSKARRIQLDRGNSKVFIFDFPEPTFVTGVLESLRGNDPDTGYQFAMEEIPSKGWSVMAWIGGLAAIGFAGWLFLPVVIAGVFQTPSLQSAACRALSESNVVPDSTTHEVLTCGGCGQKLRVPKLGEQLLVTCPRCRNGFSHKS